MLQLGQTLLRLAHPLLAFEHERLGDDGDGECPHAPGYFTDQGSSARASAATHPGSNEHQVAP